MRLVRIQNVRIGTGLYEGFQDKTDPAFRVLDACIQFPV